MARKRRKSDDSDFVTRAECSRISGEIKSELNTIKVALVGKDMRGGLLKDMRDMKSSIESLKHDIGSVKDYIDNQKRKGRDWRLLGFAILGSVISGIVIALLNYWLSLL